jgi:hypothetical protein
MAILAMSHSPRRALLLLLLLIFAQQQQRQRHGQDGRDTPAAAGYVLGLDLHGAVNFVQQRVDQLNILIGKSDAT